MLPTSEFTNYSIQSTIHYLVFPFSILLFQCSSKIKTKIESRHSVLNNECNKGQYLVIYLCHIFVTFKDIQHILLVSPMMICLDLYDICNEFVPF